MGGAFYARAFDGRGFFVGVLLNATAIAVSASGTLSAPQPLDTSAAILVGVTASLRAPVTLAAAPGITLATDADLRTFTGIAAAAGIALSVAPPFLAPAHIFLNSGAGAFYGVAFYYPAFGFGQSYAGINVASHIELTAPIIFRADVAQMFVSARGQVSLKPILASATGIAVGVAANLVVVGVSGSTPILVIGGQPWTARVGSAVVRDMVNEQVNTFECMIDDPASAPVPGNDLRLGLGSILPARLIFGGVIQSVDDTFTLTTDHPSWRVRAVDYGVLLNRRQVWCTYTNVSATTAAFDLLARFSSGFTGTHIAVGLPAITLTLDEVNLSAAFTELANLIGGYWYVDYAKDVHLFVNETDPATDPHPLDGTPPAPLADPILTMRSDNSQRRTRILVVGVSVKLLAPVRASDGQIPIETAEPFAGAGAMAQFGSDGARVDYTSTAPGDATGILTGNVTKPGAAPNRDLAVGVAGQLSGWYQWAVAFGTGSGETPVGPRTPALFCPAFTTPGAPPGVGPTGIVGPLAGGYFWAVSFVTTLGETLVGPLAYRNAIGITPGAANLLVGPAAISRLSPGAYTWVVTFLTAYGETGAGQGVTATLGDVAPPVAPFVATAGGSGPIPIGLGTGYRCTFVSQDGETAGGPGVGYTPPGFSGPPCSYTGMFAHGGVYGGPYSYAVSIVTANGESPLTGSFNVGSGFFTASPQTAPSWVGSQDTNGRIVPGFTYYWAASFFSDAYGETGLSYSYQLNVGGASQIRLLFSVPALQGGADGIRIYRAQANGPFTLNAEFRRANYPTQYWDFLGQGEQGASYPVQSQKAGVMVALSLGASAEAGVLARRLYRTKSGGSEWFLVGELQSNTQVTFYDVAFDQNLTTRNPVTGLAGRTASLTGIPIGPVGTIARRIYRYRTGAYYLVGDLKDNTSTTWIDAANDSALSVTCPGINTAGARYASAGQPLVLIPTGPPGVTGRRVYRTPVNGATPRLALEIPDNTTTTILDNVPDASLGSASVPPVNTAGGEQVRLTSILTGPAGTLARRVYRTVAGGVDLRLVQQINDNTTTSVVDAVADRDLGANGPLQATAGASAVTLTNIPLGPGDVSRRLLYRTTSAKDGSGGGDLQYVATLSDNTTTSYTDTRGDDALGKAPESTSTIGALAGQTTLVLSSVAGFPSAGWVDVDGQLIRYTGITGTTLTGIPALLPATITRAAAVATILVYSHGWATGDTIVVIGAQQSEYNGAHVVTVLDLNWATFPVSGTPVTPATPAATRAATITRDSATATIVVHNHGWLTGNTIIVVGAAQPEYNGAHVVTVVDTDTARYSVSGSPATPATPIPGGAITAGLNTVLAGLSGAITRAVDGGATATTVPMLTGVTGLTTPRLGGDSVALFVVCNDLAAQANLGAAEGGDGIHEAPVRDATLTTIAACTARGNAELKMWAWPQVEITYASHDPLTRSGRTIQVNLPELGMVATLKILEVTLDEIGVANRLYPRCTVRAASAKFTLEDLLRHAVLDV
jgi:hypothetical protein